MANYGHGGNIKEISRKYNIELEDIIDFSANINPLGMPDSAKECIVNNLNQIEKYPDISYFDLKEDIKRYENSRLGYDIVSSENIILGNGAAEVIYNVVRAVNPKKTMIMAPTFSEYEEAVTSISKETILYKLNESDDFTLTDDILNSINNDIDMIFICNPNNPTGSLVSKELLLKLMNIASDTDTFVVIDESFLDFIKDDFSMISCLNNYDNLIIIKSLTKFFAIPGLRIGYGLCGNKHFSKKAATMSPAWNINILADICARTCLSDKKYINDSIEYMEKERIYMYNELKKVNYLKVYEPRVNFIFFKVKNRIDLKQELLKKNILIRSCSNYNSLDESYFRIAVRTHEENIRILNALNSILDR